MISILFSCPCCDPVCHEIAKGLPLAHRTESRYGSLYRLIDYGSMCCIDWLLYHVMWMYKHNNTSLLVYLSSVEKGTRLCLGIPYTTWVREGKRGRGYGIFSALPSRLVVASLTEALLNVRHVLQRVLDIVVVDWKKEMRLLI